MVGLIVAAVLVLYALFVAAKTVRIIPQARAGVVERLGRYSRTLTPGMTIVVPFIDPPLAKTKCGCSPAPTFSDPLNIMCSNKWAKPVRSLGSMRKPML